MNHSETVEIDALLARSVSALLACEAAMPAHADLAKEHAHVRAADERGYFHPDEEEVVLLRYTQYLAVRSALIQILDDMQKHLGNTVSGWRRWPHRLPVFVTACAAACLRHRAATHLVELAADRPVLWKKLDEENLAMGLPRKSFTCIYREFTRPRNTTRLLVAVEFYRRHREEVMGLVDDPTVGPAVGLLSREEPRLDLAKRDLIKRGAAYRWFSFLRRHRSAWKQVTFGLFEVGGRAVADLRVPGVKQRGAPKRMSPERQRSVIELLQPGDVVVTRHDDALSNLFLPGYWPHAALFIGEPERACALSANQRGGDLSGPCFLEAKKDGVRVRRASETLEVDELLVLRPPLCGQELQQALDRALDHAGKPYDFLFDFRTADRMVCTEVVYRAYHGYGPVHFELNEVGGRLCLPAEAFLDQSMACGFELVAVAGLGEARAEPSSSAKDPGEPDGEVLEGEAARRAFEGLERPAPSLK